VGSPVDVVKSRVMGDKTVRRRFFSALEVE
jgi:hypothetical protein